MDIKGVFKKDYVIGLDIGSSSIKIAQFRKSEAGLSLIKAELREIASAASPPRNDREGQIVAALKDLLQGIDLKKSKVIASINCPKTAVKITKVPYMPKSELREGIKLEAHNYFPFPMDESLMDYEILRETVEKGVRKYEILVAVSPKKTVDSYLSMLNKAGIKPSSLVPCSDAMQKVAETSYSEGDKLNCFVDIGQRYTELFIFEGKELVFSRKIPISSADITEAMTGTLVSDRGQTKLSLEEAEKIKKDVGIPQESGSRIIDDKISSIQVLSMMRAPLEQLTGEIERSFDYYREASSGGRVESVILFGGGSSLSGFTKFLSNSLGIEVRIGDSLEGLNIEEGAVGERGKIAHKLGLAIGAALKGTAGINLLPAEIKEETQRIFRRSTIEALGTALVITAVLFYIGMKIQLNNFEKRISVAKVELSSLQHQFKQAEAYHLANMVLVDEPHWEDVLKELSNVIPDDIYLTNLNLKDNTIIMEGIISSSEGEGHLSDFILTLEKGIFKNVKLVKIEDLAEVTGNKFELKCSTD